MNKKTLVIQNPRMAGMFLACGFVLLGRKKDLKNKNRYIWIFNDTPKIREVMSKYNDFKMYVAENISN